MDAKAFWILAALMAAFFVVQAAAQVPTAPRAPTAFGEWQIVAGGGDGGAAFKMNTSTGESYFCYRQNCFRSVQQ